MPKTPSVLIVGLGIAGMATALRLHRAGWAPVIVERASARRTGGYMVGMFPEGIAAATRLGVNDDITERNAPGMKSFHIDLDGSRKPGIGFADQPGKPKTVLRGDIESGLWQHIQGKVEVRFGTTPVAIEQAADAVVVTLRAGEALTTETFDLLVGADGLRSTTRRLAFGPDELYIKPMKAMVCTFQLERPLNGLDAMHSAIVADSKRSMWVFALRDTAPTVLFTYRTKRIGDQFTRPHGEIVRKIYAGMSGGGLVPEALDALEAVETALFDSVEQCRMPSWHNGRVVLVGDAAWCLTLYSGMGATASMLGGATLGDQLEAHPNDISAALDAYEAELRPFVNKHQRSARLKSELFVPSSRIAWWIRRQLLGSKIGQRAALPAGSSSPASV